MSKGRAYKGLVWVHTLQSDGMIKFTIGNEGSSIQGDVEKIFDAFYTHGKRGGTGLGLAVAKKVVEAHGGTIDVYSDEKARTVEFSFTLPASQARDPMIQVTLPLELSKFLALKPTNQMDHGTTQQQMKLYQRIRNLIGPGQEKVRVAILDDEKVYRSALMALGKIQDLENLIQFSEFATPQDLLAANEADFQFVICDVDLQDPEYDGYDVVRSLKEKGFQGASCIHSDKASTQDFSKAQDVGAEGFLPKPMSLDHLLKFILDGLSTEKFG